MNYSDRDNGALSSNTRHCTPLECRHEEESCPIDIALRWSEKQTTKEHLLKACHRFKDVVLLAERIIPTGIMARYQMRTQRIRSNLQVRMPITVQYTQYNIAKFGRVSLAYKVESH